MLFNALEQMASLVQTEEVSEVPGERVLSAEQEKAQQKLVKQQGHEIRMLGQRKKKEAKKIKDKAKRMEHYKRYDVVEEELKEKHAIALEQLLSSLETLETEENDEKGNGQDAPSAEEPQETAEEEKIRKKREKAARKRQAKLEKERAEALELENERNKQVDYRAIENERILGKVAGLGLSISDIKADGNCLFRSIVHQLGFNEAHAGALDVCKDHEALRKAAAQHMRSNAASYAPFLAADNKRNESFLEYCDRMENTADWGGELELRALSEVLRVPITIHSAGAQPILMGENEQGPTLNVSYHKQYYALGMHYNSLVPTSRLFATSKR